MSVYLVTNRMPNVNGSGWTYFRTDDASVAFYRVPNSADLVPASLERLEESDGSFRAIAVEAIQLAWRNTLVGWDAPGQARVRENFLHPPTVLVFVHGYNNSIDDAMSRTLAIRDGLADNGVKVVPVCFSWPSDGKITNYLQDRDDADLSAQAVVNAMGALYHNLDLRDCQVNLVLVGHSMGTRVLREGLHMFAKQLGQPRAFPIFAELALVAADIDSNSLSPGESGAAMVGLSRRVTTYSSRFDDVLVVSQEVKNSGTARLGRNGPSDPEGLPSNVVAVDCSDVIRPASNLPIIEDVESFADVHSGYFSSDRFYEDLTYTVVGRDRAVIPTRQAVPEGQFRTFKLMST